MTLAFKVVLNPNTTNQKYLNVVANFVIILSKVTIVKDAKLVTTLMVKAWVKLVK